MYSVLTQVGLLLRQREVVFNDSNPLLFGWNSSREYVNFKGDHRKSTRETAYIVLHNEDNGGSCVVSIYVA